MICVTYCFSFFSVISTLFDFASCIFTLKCCNCCYQRVNPFLQVNITEGHSQSFKTICVNFGAKSTVSSHVFQGSLWSSQGNSFFHLRRFAQFGTIFKNKKSTHGRVLLLVRFWAKAQVTLLHGWFSLFKIVQMVPNCAKRLMYMTP